MNVVSMCSHSVQLHWMNKQQASMTQKVKAELWWQPSFWHVFYSAWVTILHQDVAHAPGSHVLITCMWWGNSGSYWYRLKMSHLSPFPFVLYTRSSPRLASYCQDPCIFVRVVCGSNQRWVGVHQNSIYGAHPAFEASSLRYCIFLYIRHQWRCAQVTLKTVHEQSHVHPTSSWDHQPADMVFEKTSISVMFSLDSLCNPVLTIYTVTLTQESASTQDKAQTDWI